MLSVGVSSYLVGYKFQFAPRCAWVATGQTEHKAPMNKVAQLKFPGLRTRLPIFIFHERDYIFSSLNS